MYVQCKTLASGGVVDLAGDENHFEFRAGLVGADFDILDVGKAVFINKQFALLGVVAGVAREETDGLAVFGGDEIFDCDIASSTERVVELSVSEAFIWGEGSASKAGFEKELVFEIG